MYRRILVPIDGSDASMAGLRHAISLAREQRAQLRILNVVDEAAMAYAMDTSGAVFTEILDAQRDEGRRVLNGAQELAKKSDVDSEIVQIASQGQPVSDIILSDAQRSEADLIVMGTHGRRGLNRLLLGSDAERVLRETRLPMLLIRPEQQSR